MTTLLIFMCVGLVLGVTWEATQKMNLSMGFDSWFYNLIVLTFFGVIGYYIADFGYLAYISGHTRTAITLGIFVTPFALMSGLAIVNIAQNGLPHNSSPKIYYFKGKEVPKGFRPD